MAVQDLLRLTLISDLKNQPTDAGAMAFVLGNASIGDGQGGFYYWDSSSVASEDLVYLNTIASNITSTGRWRRAFQKVTTLPQGILVNNGGVKTLYAPGVTNSNGQAQLYLTTDNTATGPSIFTALWFNQSNCITGTGGASTAIQDYVVSQDLKQTTHGYFKANAVTVTLGLLYSPFAAVAAGQTVYFRVEGI